jgi:SAM-dependent methyltransferase
MCEPKNSFSEVDDYGQKLYKGDEFKKSFFQSFGTHQESSAELIWNRIISRVGSTPGIDQDPDLPRINRIIDYGCGEGTFLRHLAAFAQDSQIQFTGLDCSELAIEVAENALDSEINNRKITYETCDSCPQVVFEKLCKDGIDWSQTALIVMGHSWFHFDQKCLIESLLTHRPALLLVDVFSSWDHVVSELRSTNLPFYEHGRICPQGKMVWLKSVLVGECGERMERGLIKRSEDAKDEWVEDWIFRTNQAVISSTQLFGESSLVTDKATTGVREPDEILRDARMKGMLRKDDQESESAYIRRRKVHHETGWGPMDCHVLVARDNTAEILNDAYLETIRELITRVVINETSEGSHIIKRAFSLFNDPREDNPQILGSREALAILPFDPNLTFSRIISLFDEKSPITAHPLLAENPSRAQTQFPSANGIFQTCLARSSSAQAFPVRWAPDYELTDVDHELGKLELEVLGLDSDGKWRDEDAAATSFFLVPFYYGSLPLFCLALSFPKHFDPSTTGFEVFYSSIKSLHDSIMVLITDEVLAGEIVRPWLERTLSDPRWMTGSESGVSRSLEEKLNITEEYLFGQSNTGLVKEAHQLGPRTNKGVLEREWKSWILGLPSQPIKDFVGVKAFNHRLRTIWQREMEIAMLDPALRISLWFQDGMFFEDVPGGVKGHEAWFCRHHLKRLRKMFQKLGHSVDIKDELDDSWLPGAVSYLMKGKTEKNGDIIRYFGPHACNHFIFAWMIEQLSHLHEVKTNCPIKANCDGNFAENCPRTTGSFANLKAVFCKTRANKGKGVRFTSRRLHMLLKAACECPITVISSAGEEDEPGEFPSEGAFFSDKDPTIILAELAHGLRMQKILEAVTMSYQGGLETRSFNVKLRLKHQLSEQIGGNQCEEILVLLDAFDKIDDCETAAPSSLYGQGELDFKFAVSTDAQTITTYKT